MKIDHNIPIPPKAPTRNGLTDALRQCTVGDSFLIPNTQTNRTGIYVCAAHLNYKVTMRKTKNGYRVWRTA